MFDIMNLYWCKCIEQQNILCQTELYSNQWNYKYTGKFLRRLATNMKICVTTTQRLFWAPFIDEL